MKERQGFADMISRVAAAHTEIGQKLVGLVIQLWEVSGSTYAGMWENMAVKVMRVFKEAGVTRRIGILELVGPGGTSVWSEGQEGSVVGRGRREVLALPVDGRRANHD